MELDEEEHGAPRRPVVLIILDGFGGNPKRLIDRRADISR